jgi:AcrR family transcriptional regulator
MTRAWIIAAFNRLVLGRRYESVSVGEVTRKAGVGRSTFYEHFRDKDDVLRQALEGLLAPLADAAVGQGNPHRVLAVLNHVAENHERSIAMLDGPARAQVEHALAQLILTRLTNGIAQSPSAAQRLNASRLAGSHVAVLQTWLKDPEWPALVTHVVSVLVDPSPSGTQVHTDS